MTDRAVISVVLATAYRHVRHMHLLLILGCVLWRTAYCGYVRCTPTKPAQLSTIARQAITGVN